MMRVTDYALWSVDRRERTQRKRNPETWPRPSKMIATTFSHFNSDGFFPFNSLADARSIPHLFSEKSQMNQAELKALLSCVEQALAVYTTHEGKLSALEISLKSMLTVVQSQVTDQLSRQAAGITE